MESDLCEEVEVVADAKRQRVELQERGVQPLDVLNGQETKLNDFEKLHPMLSSDMINPSIFAELSNALERQPIQLLELPVVDKSYEDQMLRPARTEQGERPCVLGEKCLCMFMARLRYGRNNSYGFVCTEFLLPDQRRAWLRGDKLPEQAGKCLVCLRYFATYLYLMIRNNSDYVQYMDRFQAQTHESLQWHDSHSGDGSVPSHAASVGTQNGYRREVLLHMDEQSMSCGGLREERAANFVFRPIVRFSSTHFKYVKTGTSLRIEQVGVGERESVHSREHLNETPPDVEVARPAVSESASRAPVAVRPSALTAPARNI